MEQKPQTETPSDSPPQPTKDTSPGTEEASTDQRPARRLGFGFGMGLITAVLVIGVTYIAQFLAGLIFPPFSLFDFAARVLPGPLITGTIDVLVRIIHGLNLGATSSTAKLVEQGMALVKFTVLGGLWGMLLGALRPARPGRSLAFAGLGTGTLLALGFTGIEAYLGFPVFGPFASFLWLELIFGVWGYALGWMLRAPAEAPAVAGETAQSGNGGPGGLTRREALYLGATSFVAVVAAALGLGFLYRERRSAATAAQAFTPTPMPLPDATVTANIDTASATALQNRIEPAPGTRPEMTPTDAFYRIDINTRPPQVDAASWELQVDGLVDHPGTFTLDDLRARPAQSEPLTLACISNPIGGDLIGTTVWTGIRLRDFLDEVGLQPEAQALVVEAADGFHETVVMSDLMDERTMLVYAMDGAPLPQEHGFPLRIYIPNRYGMKQPKWIVHMQAVADTPDGYWVRRGWSRTAVMRTTSVIDTATAAPDAASATTFGGIAHAGARGISKVELQVDDGPWQEAELRVPPRSDLTWVQWRYTDTFPAGTHTARVRAYDGTGELQVMDESPPHPDGATGVHTVQFDV
ncbi:MAG: molybdopterin-dependent oxidoreductase [Caldilineaceae bacterium]|nr:molybdopterin-dependent oxidoreductase [Caldilineaceae bacterium]